VEKRLKPKTKLESTAKKTVGSKSVINLSEKFDLTAAAVCDIIQTCARSGVAVLKFRDLEVTFGKLANVDAPLAPEASLPEAEISEPKLRELHEESLNKDVERVREEQLEDLILTNPLEYERLYAAGELGEEDGDETDIEEA
jgi:hypothetical protein